MALTTELPTLYEYYGGNHIEAGLSASHPKFTLNNKEITLYSGAFHYFRVPRPYWRDRLRKMRAAGLNTVETYIPWNLHEPQEGMFDFGTGGSDWEDFLHIEEFLTTAKEEDLFVLIRPGPYICAEWEFGGFPSWIERYVKSVRNSKDTKYLSLVQKYFNVLLPVLAMLQFQNGGSIIGFQIENEYASFGVEDPEYLYFLKQLYLKNNIKELLYTSDAARYLKKGAIPGVFQTANIGGNVWDILLDLTLLRIMHPFQPLMTMESYTGWFDHWTEYHEKHIMNKTMFGTVLTSILDMSSSINMYMFVGGTNFGFLNGANLISRVTTNSGLEPTTTSYDYDSPISEFGNLTEKYYSIKQIIEEHSLIKTKIPEVPVVKSPIKYWDLTLKGQISISKFIEGAQPRINSYDVIPMEKLPINSGGGQSFGYIVYRKKELSILADSILKISGFVRDTVIVLVNGRLVSPVPTNASDLCRFGFWKLFDSNLKLPETQRNASLDLIVENMGRVNYGSMNNFVQFKGLVSDVYLNDEKLVDWEIIPLEFKKSWNENLAKRATQISDSPPPALYRFELNLNNEPEDTFLDMRNWTKGITIVNGFVLGRHFFVGPQQSLFLPAPFLNKGKNDILVFEHYKAADSLKFVNVPLFWTPFNFTKGCTIHPSPPSASSDIKTKYLFRVFLVNLVVLKYLI